MAFRSLISKRNSLTSLNSLTSSSSSTGSFVAQSLARSSPLLLRLLPASDPRPFPPDLAFRTSLVREISTDAPGASESGSGTVGEEMRDAVPPKEPSERERNDAKNISAEVLLPGCDFKHWLIFMDPPGENTHRDDIIDSYIKTLAQVVGSEEEAKMKIYSVSTKHYYAFGVLIPQEVSNKLKTLPGVRWVLPDSYLHPKTKDYGGEPFIDGKAVPYDPKYHAVWLQNNQNPDGGRRKPRNFDRPRDNWQNRDFQNRPRSPMPNQNRGFEKQPGPPVPNQGNRN